MRAFRIPLIFVMFLVGCGGSLAERADKSMTTAMASTRAAHEAFVAFDKDHQARIVDEATSREEGTAKLRLYRQRREAVMKAFTIAYSAIGAAVATIPLVERGEKKDGDLRAVLFDALRAVLAVDDAVKQVKAELK